MLEGPLLKNFFKLNADRLRADDSSLDRTNDPAAITNKSPWLTGLNEAQLRAVKHVDGPMLVFAGAGSGKTRVLTRRIANLVLTREARTSEILAVTFTNKAAAEMKERIRLLLGNKELGFTKNFVIFDSGDSLSAMKRVYKAMGINPKSIEPRSVLRSIDRAKNAWKDAESIRNDNQAYSDTASLTADLFEAYQEELLKCNAMDFGDLLCNTLSLLELDSNLREKFQNQFKYILVDEYQDTNTVQYLLLKKLSEKRENICAVGDDDQSIYAFRGASVDKILSFEKDYPNAEIVTLDTNYRSTSTILDVANRVIAKNERRQSKQMCTDNAPGEKVTCFKAWNEKYEAQFVVSEVLQLLETGVDLESIAVFYRTNAQSRALEESLLESAIPYEIYGGQKFYDRKEIKDLLAYLRLLINEKDDESFLRIINTPARGIGPTSVGALQRLASAHSITLLEAARIAVHEAKLSKAAGNKLTIFLSMFDRLSSEREKAESLLEEAPNTDLPDELEIVEDDSKQGSSPAASTSNQREVQFYAVCDLLKSIAEKSGYITFLKKQGTEEADSRLENIHELFAVALDYVSRHFELTSELPPLAGFLDRVSLASDLDKSDSSEEDDVKKGLKYSKPLSLMTLHLAKGLEFDYVFLAGLEEGLLPHSRSMEDKDSLEEERRLCYVGITRAKKKLFLSRAADRQTWTAGGFYSGMASRFIEDIPEESTEDRESSGFFEFY